MHSADVIQLRTNATNEFAISQIERGRSLLESFANLRWLPEVGIGWYPVDASIYDAEYWNKYRALDASSSGDALTACRISLVRSWFSGTVVDVGIGGGRFVTDHPSALGFDINPAAVAWLRGKQLYCDPHVNDVEAATFWDSLEHIHDPGLILKNVRRFAFVSLPIFENAEHVLRSKHFKPREHCWYFTRAGFNRFMNRFGFRMVDHSTIEQMAGREDIESFAFERVRDATE